MRFVAREGMNLDEPHYWYHRMESNHLTNSRKVGAESVSGGGGGVVVTS